MTDLEALVTLGLMGSRKPPAFCDQNEILYFATEEGERFATAQMPPAPKRTNFDAYLNESECYDSFAHFLGIKMPRYQKHEYRMVRYRPNINRFHSADYLLLCEPAEIAGEWCLDKKEAKTSTEPHLKRPLAEPDESTTKVFDCPPSPIALNASAGGRLPKRQRNQSLRCFSQL
ncbi:MULTISPECIES: hypothetical protein [Pseudomonas]|uniref:hypothetical protein n=1 Tax=Pseudomonas TaxID=286 RepID=UPI001864E202|nr:MULTISPECIES: hypothetical protein [Pseudomonas]